MLRIAATRNYQILTKSLKSLKLLTPQLMKSRLLTRFSIAVRLSYHHSFPFRFLVSQSSRCPITVLVAFPIRHGPRRTPVGYYGTWVSILERFPMLYKNTQLLHAWANLRPASYPSMKLKSSSKGKYEERGAERDPRDPFLSHVHLLFSLIYVNDGVKKKEISPPSARTIRCLCKRNFNIFLCNFHIKLIIKDNDGCFRSQKKSFKTLSLSPIQSELQLSTPFLTEIL